MEQRNRGIVFGFAAAVSFGVSAPLAKRLLDDITPQLLAGLLYLGAFVALAAALPSRGTRNEAPLRRADLPRVAALVATGGIAAPVLLLAGLERVSGATGSLLLNLEGPLTLLLAVALFREHLGRLLALGALAIFGGAALLSWNGSVGAGGVSGIALIAGACALWAVDNNITQTLTVRDPFAIVTVKAGVAALVNVVIAIVLGAHRPAAGLLAAALALGAVSYGVSVLLDAYALRALGAAREAAIFATAPFVGALVAVPVLGDGLGRQELLAGAVMAAGVAFMLTEDHAHEHTHELLVHEHVHTHDAHHRHVHPDGVAATEPHAHPHRHTRLVHSHAHVSDLHHRHGH